MKLGVLADIHEHVEHLRTALDRFRDERVDRVVVLGDVCERGERLAETCSLLVEADAVGVWGNHDFGVCVDPTDEMRAKYGDATIDFMMSLKPRLTIGDCHFTHIEPWLDPNKFEDLWFYDDLPVTQAKRDRIFRAAAHRVMFAGHFHRPFAITPTGELADWASHRAIRLAPPDRYFVVVGTVTDGLWALYDTESHVLTPHSA